MSFLLKWLSTPKWPGTDSVPGTAASNRLLMLPKALYKEHRRSYKASPLELLKLISNERKVYAGQGQRVIWRCRQQKPGQFTVLYAVIDNSAESLLVNGWQLVLPETWLLYSVLQPETLYQVQSAEQYWAWLSADQQLHTTPVRGLMNQPQYFLDAIGVSYQSKPTVLTLPQTHETAVINPLSIDWLGLSVWRSASKSAAQVPWRKLMLATGIIAVGYMAVLSAALTLYEQRLSAQVAQLQTEANQVFNRQQQLSDQMSILQSYQQFLQRFPAGYPVLALLAEQLEGQAILQSVQLSGQLIQISGNAESATAVLATLSQQAQWSEVKFERNVQRIRGQENFTISMVYNGLKEQSVD